MNIKLQPDDHPILVVDKLSVAYGELTTFRDLDLEVKAGDAVAVIGPSGSGKSSLLNCVVGTLLPASGSVTVCGTELTRLSAAGRARVRRELIGVTFQDPDLLPELSIVENVAITMLFDGVPRDQARAAARRSLEAVDVESHVDKRTDEVSGGEAQRIALARALARTTIRLLVADEPTASLDAANAARVADLIVCRTRDLGIATIVGTHDDRIAERCDRIVDLRSVGTSALTT